MNGDTQASSSNVCVTNGFTLQAVLYSIYVVEYNIVFCVFSVNMRHNCEDYRV